MRRHRARVAVLALALTVAATGCGTDEEATSSALTRPPAQAVTVLDGGPAELAVAMSRILYERAPAVVLADESDPASWVPAAKAATSLGVPLLLNPAPEDGSGAGADGGEGASAGVAAMVDGEVERLGPDTVLTFGGGVGPEDLPSLPRPEPLATVTVLAHEDEVTTAALATARAAGARVLTTTATDPRADPGLIAALSEQPPTHTVALGAGFGPEEVLAGRLEVAVTGVQLPGGGQVVFPGRRLVALYGHPGNTVLGALGEQDLAETVERATRLAAEYQSLVDEPVVPAFEIITTIASASAEPTGDYSRRTPVDDLRPWIDAAREAGIYVVLDLQPGHTDFLTQAQEYEELLREPHVGLALDPEWRLAPGQRHMVQIGSVDAAEVNRVVTWLADLTAEHDLPQKLLVLHQFTLAMITNRARLDTSRDELAVMIHADGFGTPGQKYETWQALHVDAPDVWWGWKNFYDEDQPTLSPAETVAVEPSPRFISYQ
ncbi:MAG: hypothetical protein FWJ70_05265 [Micromonosporaceae bacterium]|jgi:hypothetical protein